MFGVMERHSDVGRYIKERKPQGFKGTMGKERARGTQKEFVQFISWMLHPLRSYRPLRPFLLLSFLPFLP